MYYSDFTHRINSSLFPKLRKADTKKTDTKPYTLAINPDNIPSELKALPQWICWRWERRESEWAKIPICAKSSALSKAETNNPHTWTTWDNAWATYTDCPGMLDGMGFVFAGTDLTGIDWDDCRYPDGTIDEAAFAEVMNLGTYWELSASGGGYHAIGRVAPEVKERFRKRKGNCEAYSCGRYFAFTGQGEGSITDITAKFAEWASVRLGLEAAKPEPRPIINSILTESRMSEAEYAYRLRRANEHAPFAAYFNDWRKVKDDHSAAVHGFVSLAAFWFGEWEAVDRAFRESSLCCDKWEDGKWERLGESEYAATKSEDVYSLPAGWNLPQNADELVSKITSKPEPKTPAYRGYFVSDLRNIKPVEWLIDQHLTEGGILTLFGQSGSFKSFMAIDMGLSVAHGVPYVGKFAAKKGKVAYLCSEGFPLLNKRCQAWYEARGLTDAKDFAAFDVAVNLADPKAREKVWKSFEYALGAPPDLVVIDTLSKNFGGLSTNEGDKMQAWYDSVLSWRVATVVVHHAGWTTDRERGSSNVRDNSTATFRCAKDASKLVCEITCLKQKDHSEVDNYKVAGSLHGADASIAFSFDDAKASDAELLSTRFPLDHNKARSLKDVFSENAVWFDAQGSHGWQYRTAQNKLTEALKEGFIAISPESPKGRNTEKLYYRLAL